jgi:hypothetical protein
MAKTHYPLYGVLPLYVLMFRLSLKERRRRLCIFINGLLCAAELMDLIMSSKRFDNFLIKKEGAGHTGALNLTHH